MLVFKKRKQKQLMLVRKLTTRKQVKEISSDEYANRFEIGRMVAQARKNSGLSQRKLADRINTTQSSIARMESGGQNFTTGILSKIAKALEKKLEIKII